MATRARKYNSSRKIGGHNWKHTYQVLHIRGEDGVSLCPRKTPSHITGPASGGYGKGDVVCMWCQWLADARTSALLVAA